MKNFQMFLENSEWSEIRSFQIYLFHLKLATTKTLAFNFKFKIEIFFFENFEIFFL